MMPNQPIKGRGAAANPANRFERLHFEPSDDWIPDAASGPATQFYTDHAQTIIAYNDSPDVGFAASVNPYRGCEHGCIYCYARPTHEYLGMSAGLDFESKIMVKTAAPELLRQELSSHKWKPQVIAMSGVTDCYQPVERKLQLTRRCLQVLAEFHNPVCIVTKNHLVTRDIDLLQPLAAAGAAAVFISITSLNPELAARMEPRTSKPEHRLAAVRALHEHGVPVGVLVAPVIPALTDHELPRILAAAGEAGARFGGFVPIRLPLGLGPLFENWLDQHYPLKKAAVLNRIRSLRQGKLNDAQFGARMRGSGIFAGQLEKWFEISCRKAGIAAHSPVLSTASFRIPSGPQLELFR